MHSQFEAVEQDDTQELECCMPKLLPALSVMACQTIAFVAIG
jgi:hypothetical protein